MNTDVQTPGKPIRENANGVGRNSRLNLLTNNFATTIAGKRTMARLHGQKYGGDAMTRLWAHVIDREIILLAAMAYIALC